MGDMMRRVTLLATAAFFLSGAPVHAARILTVVTTAGGDVAVAVTDRFLTNDTLLPTICIAVEQTCSSVTFLQEPVPGLRQPSITFRAADGRATNVGVNGAAFSLDRPGSFTTNVRGTPVNFLVRVLRDDETVLALADSVGSSLIAVTRGYPEGELTGLCTSEGRACAGAGVLRHGTGAQSLVLRDVNGGTKGYSLQGAELPGGQTVRIGSRVLQYALIGPAPAAVPEPATWATMIAGFALVGGAVRRRDRRMGEAAA